MNFIRSSFIILRQCPKIIIADKIGNCIYIMHAKIKYFLRLFLQELGASIKFIYLSIVVCTKVMIAIHMPVNEDRVVGYNGI